MTKQGIIALIVVLAVVVGIIILLVARYEADPYIPSAGQNSSVANFEECVVAGYPVMESYPRQCRTASGELFVEVVSVSEPVPTPAPSPAPTVGGECYVGGCSGQICSDQKDAASTCEFMEEYVCYRSASCERQASGQCGWTETAALRACLENPSSL